MTGSTDEPVLRPLQYLPYNIRNQIVPRDENGYVYCLMSQATYMDTYIGTTSNLIKRINKHNSAAGGAKFTRLNSLKPWVCIGFVVGFPDKSVTRLQFERQWQRLKVYRGNQRLNPIQVITLGKELVEAWNLPHEYNLLFIQCIEHRTHVVS
jgi:predicted GIY-YIG superfamily endonuclease